MAKRSILDILINVVKKGDGDQATIKGLTQVKSAIGQAGMVFGALTGIAYGLNKAFDATGGEFVRYAKDVRGLSQAFNLEAEDASRLIQVMDDLGISQDTLTKALKTMATNGVEPSLAGLQQLSTEYGAIQDPAKQAAFLVDQFGKAGLDMAAAMKLGADGLAAMNDGVEEGLVLTNQSLQSARAYEIQVDQLTDSWTAFKMTIGQAVVPALNSMLIHMQAQNNVAQQMVADGKQVLSWSKEYQDAVKAEEQALIAKQQAQLDAEMGMEKMTEETIAAAAAERELDAANRALAAGLSGELANAMTTSAEKMAQLRDERDVMMAQLIAISEDGLIGSEVEEYDNLSAALQQNKADQDALSQSTQETINKLLYQKVASHLTADAALDYARSLKLISEKDYALQKGIDLLTEKYDTNKDGIVSAEENASKYTQEVEKLRNMILQLPAETVVDVIVNYISNGTPPPSTPEGQQQTSFVTAYAAAGTTVSAAQPSMTGAPRSVGGGGGVTFNGPITIQMSAAASWGDFLQTIIEEAG